MEVVFSIGGCTFNGGGIGTTSYFAVSGIHRHGWLKQLIVADYNPSEIDEKLITRVPSRIRGLRRAVGDRWAGVINDYLHAKMSAMVVREADIFHAWAGMGLEAMSKVKTQRSKVVLDRASSHILEAKEIMTEEYERWGLEAPEYINWAVKRELKEYDLADYIFTPSEFARESFLKRGFEEEKVKIIRFGTDSHPEPLDASRGELAQEGKVNALFVGEVGFRKGILYALQAWQKADINKGKFYVVGPITNEIKPFLSKFEEDVTIEFTGYADSSLYFPKADVFIFPSLEEGSALVTYEALSYGLPVITTFNSGSIVTNGQEGFVVAERHPEDVKEALERIAADEDLRKQMSEKALETVKQYPWESYGDRVVKMYRSLKT